MRIRSRVSDSAVLWIGPVYCKWRASSTTVIAMTLVSYAVYLLLFAWYATSSIARTYPTGHTKFLYGILHGYFIVPSFIMSWFSHDVTVFQSPNDGFWYILGFLLGIGAFAYEAKARTKL